MGTNQVAEGPLIKRVPGGFAEFRAKESGLPPARLNKSGGEWWGKLVGPADTTGANVDDPIVVDPPKPPVESADPNFIQPDPNTDIINWDFYNRDYEPMERYEMPKVDFNVNTNFELPEGHGWGTPDATLPYSGGLGRDDDFRFYDPKWTPDKFIGPKLPLGTQEQELGEPIVIRPKGTKREPKLGLGGEKPFRFYDSKWNPNTFSNRVKGITSDVIGGISSLSDAIVGKTQFDQYPRPPKELEVGRLAKKIKDLIKGRGEESFLLYETQGVPSAGDRTPFGPDVLDTIKNLGKFIQNEHNIKTQEYGKAQVIAIINWANLINKYGTPAAVPAVALTLAKDIMAGVNNAFADHPEFRGNPVQDLVHGTTWVLGQTLEKTYNETLGKIIGKIDSDKIKESLSKLNIIEASKMPPVKTGLKITYTPPKDTRLSPRGGEPQMPVPNVSLPGRVNPREHDRGPVRGDESEPFIPTTIGQETSPIMGQEPQGQTKGAIETFGGKSPEQIQPQIIDAKTIVPTSPVGNAGTEPLPTGDRLDIDSKPEISQGDPLGGGVTGRVTGELAYEMTDEEARNAGLLPEERDEWDGIIDAETMLKIRQQVGLERRQNYFKENGQFEDDATNEAFTKGPYNWLEHGEGKYTGKVDTNLHADNQNIAAIEDTIGRLNALYDDKYRAIQFSNEYGGWDQTLDQKIAQNEALREVDRDRANAIRPYQQQIEDIKIDNLTGEGEKEYTTESAVGIFLNNPTVTAGEAVEIARKQAGDAEQGIYDATREDTDLKAVNFWNEITGEMFGKTGELRQQIADLTAKSRAAKREQDRVAFEKSREIAQGISDRSDKLMAENKAAAEKFTKEMRDFYEKLAEKEPLLAAGGAADLAKLGVSGKMVYKGDDGGIVQVKNKDGKVTSFAYVSPEAKKVIDDELDGWIRDDHEILKPRNAIEIDIYDPASGGP